jgi:hypothetical protein
MQWVENNRTPNGGIKWKHLICEIERNFRKLRTENYVNNYWYSRCRSSIMREELRQKINTSGYHDIDEFIKNTACDERQKIEWVPFDRLIDIKQIGEGGFAKVYSATWILVDHHMKVALKRLKRLNKSQDMSNKYLNEVYISIFFY